MPVSSISDTFGLEFMESFPDNDVQKGCVIPLSDDGQTIQLHCLISSRYINVHYSLISHHIIQYHYHSIIMIITCIIAGMNVI